MSHGEIWDDSSLVDSWNDALEEYKQYHSIHARGERIEDVLKNFDAIGEPLLSNGKLDDEDAVEKTAEVNPDGWEEPEISPDKGHESRNKPSLGDQSATTQSGEKPLQSEPVIPQHLVGSVQDESLKTLLMSWYYAGYYTGLYEGQQKRN